VNHDHEPAGDGLQQDPLARAVVFADARAGERVLDLSGRAGSIALQVAPAAASVEAIQPAAELAEEGRRLARVLERENVYFHACALHRLPFDDGQFDLVFWCLGLSREPRPIGTLEEISRVLAPQGRLVLQDVVAFGRPVIDLKVWELERRRSAHHLLFYQEAELESLVSLAGMQISRREHSALTQDFDYWADTTGAGRDEIDELKRVFFTLPPREQDELDLALADGRISFAYPVLTLLVERARKP
jgi:ubiquinone/menaquinone biosynthesis C-methylase UbiE